MLCSISRKKSNSNWLERLRSAKGFIAGAQFSSGQPSSVKSTEAQETQERSPLVKSTEAHESQQRSPFLGDVLATMFAFGPDASNFPTKKAPRKMPNPRSCKVESNYSNGDLGLRMLQRSNDGCRDESGKMLVQNKRFLGEEDEKIDGNLSAFSRTEVTVIDTSFKGWKFEKVLFRKKSVWKVRDSKSISSNSESNSNRNINMKMKIKKRRKIGADEEVGVCKKKKKKMKKNIDLGQCSLAREGKKVEFTMQINDEESAKGRLIRYT